MKTKKKPTPKTIRIPVTPGLVFKSTGLDVRADTWRKMPAMVSSARNVIASPPFQQMLECLRTESPANFGLAYPAGVQERAAHQALTEGYNQCINVMLSLAEPWQDESMPEPEFPDEPTGTPKNHE
jgi:hypothetical protein